MVKRSSTRSSTIDELLSAPGPEPILQPPSTRETCLLRCEHLDARLFIAVLGRRYPADTVATPGQRARVAAQGLPGVPVLSEATALWVHTGLRPPWLAALDGTGGLPRYPRGSWGPGSPRRSFRSSDLTTIEGVRCCTLARTAVDAARLAPPATAVTAVLAARRADTPRWEMYLALSHCHGDSSRGTTRARELIESVWNLG